MKDIYKLVLLHNIKYNLGVDSLIEMGLNYSQISAFISDLGEEGLVDGRLRITKEGEETLSMLNEKYSKYSTNQWLQAQHEQRIDRMGLYDVYLPKKKE